MTDMLTTEHRRSDAEITRATARRLSELHTMDGTDGNRHCWWCLKSWPCPDSVWSSRVLHGGTWPQHSL